MVGPEKFIGFKILNFAWSLVLPNQKHMPKIEAEIKKIATASYSANWTMEGWDEQYVD